MYQLKKSQFSSWYEKVEADFPEGKYKVNDEEDQLIPMRDGVKLNTRIFRPDIHGPYDVLFTRNPYPNNEALLEAIYIPFVEQGYCLIIQDCRGTGKSQGEWQPFKNERNDGIDSLKWLNDQVWIKQIATFGRSYSGYTQWIVGDHLPEKVKTMFIEVYGVNRYDQVYSNGMFREDIYTSWAFQNSLVKSDIPVAKQYQKALKIYPAIERDEKILGKKLDFYRDYLTHTDGNDSYWKKSIWQTLADIPSKIKVPVVVTDGWADHHLAGSLLGYRRLRTEVKEKSRLIVTPTDHIGQTTGNLKYPNKNKYGFFNLKANLIWFNHILRHSEQDLQSGLYQMNTGSWINPDQLENSKALKLYLQSNNELGSNASTNGEVDFDYNPTRPNTWPAGNELLAWIAPGFTDQPHGFIKTKAYANRSDVVRFVSPAFENGLQVEGQLAVQLKVDTNVDDTAFAVRIVEETSNGDYINLKDGINSLSNNDNHKNPPHISGTKEILKINLGDIVWCLQPKSRIVLLISSTNFPMYAIHSNKYGLWSKQKIEEKIAHQRIFTDPESFITISIEK